MKLYHPWNTMLGAIGCTMIRYVVRFKRFAFVQNGSATLCRNCEITFVAVHWYNDHTLFGDFQNRVNAACSFGLQVWITEVRVTEKCEKEICSHILV